MLRLEVCHDEFHYTFVMQIRSMHGLHSPAVNSLAQFWWETTVGKAVLDEKNSTQTQTIFRFLEHEQVSTYNTIEC